VTYSRKLVRRLVLVGMLLLILTHDAFAYIDPGTGSYFLQLLIAGLLGAFFAIKIFWKNIKASLSNLFSKGQKKKDDSK
jgi:hypothetical protein